MVAHKAKLVITRLTGVFALICASFAVAVIPGKVNFDSPPDGFLGPVLGDYEYKVTDGDTLWNLSERISTNGITIWQTMDAIYLGNPSAFLYADAGKIIVESVVKLPTFNEVSHQTGHFVSETLGLEINSEPLRPAVIEARTLVASIGYHLVTEGDTLWNLSERVRPEGTTIRQTMDAIFVGNPLAFLYEDASKIIINTRIKLPTFEQTSIQTGHFVSDQLNRTVYLENSDTGSDDDANSSTLLVNFATDTIVEGSASVEHRDTHIIGENPTDSDQPRLIPYRVEVDVMSFIEDVDISSVANKVSPGFEEQTRLSESTEVELENQALRQEVLVLTTKLEELSLSLKVTANIIEIVPVKSQREKSSSAFSWIENQPWYIASLLAALVTMLGFFTYKAIRTPASEHKASLGGLYEAPSDFQVEVAEIVFDETDGDIFADQQVESDLGGFDLMVEPVSEAEVHLSLGQYKEALDILERAREADSDDMSSRLKLLEIYLSEELAQPLGMLHEEIKSSGDTIAIAKAELMLTAGLQQGQNSLEVDEQAAVLDKYIGAPVALDDAFPDIDERFDADVLESINALELTQTADLSDLEYLDEFQDISPVDIKLDLASTYADLGDKEGARAILNEILADANKIDKSRAQTVLDQLDL